jgi:hypothetical protein
VGHGRGENEIHYGTTGEKDGPANLGTVFSLTPPELSGGIWTEKMLYTFGTNKGDGIYPTASLTIGPHGAIYGTTSSGGICGFRNSFQPQPAYLR